MLTLAEFDAVLQRYLAGQSLPGEQQLVESWSQQLGQADDLPLPPAQLAEIRTAMWERIVVRTAAAEEAAPRVIAFEPPRQAWWRRPALRWAAAATLVLGASGWWLSSQRPVAAPVAAAKWEQRTNLNQPSQTLRLADGTRVTLYAGSTLRYRTGPGTPRRETYLTGQAYFEVAKNPARPFLVFTDQLVTTVLGTSFLVTAYAHQPNKVAVREGRVAVQRRPGADLASTPAQPAPSGVLLLPNQQVKYATGTQPLTRTLVEVPVRVQQQPLSFRKRPVAEVLTALEQAYGVRIVYNAAKLQGCTITIDFGDEPLYEQLDALCKALDAQYRQGRNAQILFESHGCQQNS